MRELAGDIYFGEHKITRKRPAISRSIPFSRSSAWLAIAFERAVARNRHLTSVDKANVLASSTLWRDTVTALAREYPGVKVDHLYVDNAAMQICSAGAV